MAGEKILVVDDDPAVLDVFTRFFQKKGYEVAASLSGQAALEAIRGEDFPLALLDLKLPDISGMELLSHLKANSPDTEVIIFTGLGALDSAVQALRLGAYDYLVKSELRLPDVQSVVDRALEHRRLSLANRELLDHLKEAREELARRRAAELVQIRRIGESLARPLAAGELAQGLLTLIWESLPLAVLGLALGGRGENPGLTVCRHREDFPPEACRRFEAWLKERLDLAARSGPVEAAAVLDLEALPRWPLLQEHIRAEPTLGLVAALREEPFSPEEAELFRIFALQGEAALKNLLLFEEVQSLAIRDGLTGLYNYRYFWEMLNQQVGQSRRYGWPLSLLFLDLDDFKAVNDTWGHPAGDLVLKTVAEFLKGALRQADVICRYGGEEFVVLLPQTDGAHARALAERLRAGIAATPVPAAGRELKVTVSAGLAELLPGFDGGQLVAVADAALYRAKQGGKNRVCEGEKD